MPSAAKHFDPVLGIDIHLNLVPPVVPLPHPHIGFLIDPFDYIPIIGGTVWVCGIMRAQAGTGGITMPPHWPTAGSFVKPPGDENEVFMGSMTVTVDGDAFSYLALPALSCQCIGAPPFPRWKGPVAMSLVLPTSLVLSIPLPVNVGGPPIVSMMAILGRLGFAMAGALMKPIAKATKPLRAQAAGAAKKMAARPAAALRGALGGLKGKLAGLKARRAARKQQNGAHCVGGHPVDILTGENYDAFLDAKAPPPRLFEWRRFYTSARAHEDGPLGHGFRHSYDHRLRCDRQMWIYEDPEGKKSYFEPVREVGELRRSNGLVLSRVDEEHAEVRDRRAVVKRFRLSSSDSPEARLVRVIQWDRWIWFEREGERLIALTEYGPEAEETRYELRYQGERITELRRVSPSPRRLGAYTYDGAGDLIESEHAEGGRHRFTYDEAHRWTRMADPRGYEFWWTYDEEGRCTETSGEDGLWSARFEYGPDREWTRVFERGAWWTYRFDPNGTLREKEDPYGGVLRREVGEDGRVLREIDAGGRVVELLYDPSGAHWAREDAFGALTPPHSIELRPADPHAAHAPSGSFEYRFGALPMFAPLASAEDPGFAPAPLRGEREAIDALVEEALRSPSAASRSAADARYDERGLPLERLDEEDRRQARYDAAGNLVLLRDREGRELHVEVVRWNLVGAVRGGSNPLRLAYNDSGEIVRVMDGGGTLTEYERDAKDRVVAVRRGGELRERYAYDRGGRLLEKKDAEGRSLVLFEYGARALPIEARLAEGESFRLGYDAQGRVIEASTQAHEVRLRYDLLGRRIEDLRDGWGIRRSVAPRGAERLEILGRFFIDREHHPGERAVLLRDPTGAVHRLRYDARGLVWREHPSGTRILSSFTGGGQLRAELTLRGAQRGAGGEPRLRKVEYARNAEGEWIGTQDSARGQTLYGLDRDGRLIRESGAGETRRFEYDAAGNLVSKPGLSDVRIGSANRLVAANHEGFRYDGRGRLVEWATEGGGRAFRYDSLDRLVRIEDESWERSWVARYDGLGRRISSGMEGREREYFWDGDRLAAERDTSGRIRLYIYADDEAWIPLIFIDYSSVESLEGEGRSYLVHTDPMGMPLEIEDHDGVVVWSALHVDPYGAILEAPLDAPLEGHRPSPRYALRWPGHYADPETGLFYNRHRYYSPILGRYLVPDPIGSEGGANIYAYPSNPLSQVDLFGLSPHRLGASEAISPSRPFAESAEALSGFVPQVREWFRGFFSERELFSRARLAALVRDPKTFNQSAHGNCAFAATMMGLLDHMKWRELDDLIGRVDDNMIKKFKERIGKGLFKSTESKEVYSDVLLNTALMLEFKKYLKSNGRDDDWNENFRFSENFKGWSRIAGGELSYKNSDLAITGKSMADLVEMSGLYPLKKDGMNRVETLSGNQDLRRFINDNDFDGAMVGVRFTSGEEIKKAVIDSPNGLFERNNETIHWVYLPRSSAQDKRPGDGSEVRVWTWGQEITMHSLSSQHMVASLIVPFTSDGRHAPH